MASFGNIENFDPSKPEKWTTYVERMIFFFLANGIEKITQKKAIFLTLIGPETYALARSLAAPKDLANVNYEEMLTILTGHFCPRPNLIVQRYHFNRHSQGDEPIATYIAELRRLSENCEFVDLDDRLRDRLVCGLKKESLVKRLLSEKDLTFEKAMDIALCDESASANASVLMETTPDVNILKKANKSEPFYFKSKQPEFNRIAKGLNKKIICIRCKGNHMPNVCKFRNAKCFKCGKIGHLQKACLTRVKKFEYLNRSNSDTYLHCIGTESLSNPFYIMVKLDNHDVAMLIDSGSAYSLLNKETFLKYWRVTQLEKSEVLLKTWSSSNVKILGKLFVKAKVTNGFKKLSILVADGLGPNILGRQWFEAFRLRINFLNHIETNPFSSEFEEVFKQEIDAYNGPLIHIDIPENAEPKFVKARTVPFALRELVDKKLKSLEEQGVIEPVKFTKWASPIVTVLKNDGTIRICHDYKSTVNLYSNPDKYPLPTIPQLLDRLRGGRVFTKLDMTQAYQQLKLDKTSAEILAINTPRGLSLKRSQWTWYIGKDQKTKWKKALPPKNVRTRSENIITHLPGVKGEAKNAKSILDCWNLFIDDNILECIVTNTNIYIRNIQQNYSRERDANLTNLHEIKALLGIIYLLGVMKANKLNTDDAWARDSTGFELCRIAMSENRFRFLLRVIRFDDKATRNERLRQDKLAAVRLILDTFVKNCQKHYSPSEYITVDEKLDAFRGKYNFRQYIPSKHNKYGIKLFALVDSKMFYTCNLEIYSGKNPEGPYNVSNSPSDVVERLCEPIKGTGRNVTMDNWFTSYSLALKLLQQYRLTIVGTLKRNKKEIPSEFVISRGIKEGATAAGLYKVKRLPFGLNSAVGTFQRFMDSLLSGINGVAVYLDDVLISGRDCDDLKRKTEKVLLRFRESGLRLKKEKCHFYVPEIEFLGMIIDHKGIHPSEEKLRAIKDARPPSNKRELMSFLGLLNYYERFLNNKATVAEALHRLLDSNSPWNWNKEHQRSFAEVKNLISSKSVLAHFNEDLPILVNCDASEYGVGAILSQIDHGVERPVVFASRTLNKTERRYAVIDKEALAVIFGVSKFAQYLLGRKFKILTDHKPLVGIFNPKKPIPQVLSPRMLRWCLTLAAYTYSIEYKPGKVNCNADALSRLPLNECPSVVPNPSEVFFIESEHAAINSSEVAKLTNKDPILSKVKFWAMNGWPERKVDDKFRDFVSKSSEISVHKDCLLWGSRVIIPERLRKDILNLLHDTHIGIVGTKALARGLCWWPKMDGDIERMISSCAVCLSCSHDPPKTDVYPWIWPSRPWSRLHIDHAGPFQGKLLLVVVDAYSKWIEAKIVSTTSTETTINCLKEIFATHGLPDVIVSDNGTSFTSELFRTFLKRNGVRHILCAPYHAASNGQVERAIQTLKNLLRKNSSGNWTTRLSRSLLSMRIAINSTTQKSPAQLLMNRNLKSLLNKFHPEGVSEGRMRQEKRFIRNWKPHRVVNEGQAVIARGYHGPRWLPGVVREKTGPVSIKVETDEGEILNRHLDQVRDCGEREATPSTSATPQESNNIEDPQAGQEIDPTGEASSPILRRSSRLRRPSKYFEI
ncbi:K02A2.6-like [Cordylochernes scorpioides]|uniref:RNA-directed DNA polymerase n=1 Tax=Cordylochernes scorpioides TaxID=51811 RepID=A0ABY6K5X2_9ARAC|nr:K02A2.6-like [Cordylochernes scorpioides]